MSVEIKGINSYFKNLNILRQSTLFEDWDKLLCDH